MTTTRQCPDCDEWKPDTAFPMQSYGRGRNKTCGRCLYLRKRAHDAAKLLDTVEVIEAPQPLNAIDKVIARYRAEMNRPKGRSVINKHRKRRVGK